MKLLTSILVFLSFLCNLHFAFATDYQVCPTCQYKHPFEIIAPQGNNPTKLQGGDTLFIGPGQYRMGLGAPNTGDTTKCYPNWPWDCVMRSIPSGPDPQHPTRIIGDCANPPQLYGVERAWYVLNLQGSSNVEIQCLDITDHSDCQVFGPKACKRDGNPPYGDWAVTGITASDSSNVLLKNVNVHGLYRGIHAGRLKDWTIEDSKIIANSFVGWDGDVGANISSNSGSIKFIRTKIQYSGCGETYPGLQTFNCYSQDQGGYGDGLGTHSTGGDWLFENSDISFNVSDGIDLLYHSGNGSVTVKNTKIEGNAGNQLKVSAPAFIDKSVLIGDCAYFKDKSFTWNTATFNHCRAQGDTVAANYRSGMTIKISDSFISGVGDVLFLSQGTNCNGTEKFEVVNSRLQPGTEFNSGEPTKKYYASGSDGNGGGPCGQLQLTESGEGTTPSPPSVPPSAPVPPPQPLPLPVCVYEWCDALLPQCGGTRTQGVTNCGDLCFKIPVDCQSVCPPCPECPPCPGPPECADLNLSPKEFYSIAGRRRCEEVLKKGCQCNIIDGKIIFRIKR